MLTTVLKSLQFSDKEANIYLALIRTGTTLISDIAKRVKLPRSTTYNILKKMEEQGVVRHVNKANKMYYTAVMPDDLIDVMKNKQEKIGDQITLLKTYLPQLQALINPNIELPKVSFHEGIKGIQEIYLDILKKTEKGGSTKALITLEGIEPQLKDWLYHKFTPKKIKREIQSQVILSSKHIKDYTKLNKKHLRETRFIAHDRFPFHVEIDLYGKNRIAIISFADQELFGLIIESANIYKTLESVFDFMWEQIPKK